MNRTTVAVIAALFALVLLAGTGWASFTTAPNQQQFEALDVNIWLSPADSTDPVRRLDPGTTAAQIVIQSNLRDNDPDQFRAEVVDANGIRIFQSDILQLPTGAHNETIVITGTAIFGAYVDYAGSEKTSLLEAVNDAVTDANKANPSAGNVRGRIQDVLAVVDRLNNGLERLRAFDLSGDGSADNAFAAAQAALTNVHNRCSEALDLLNADPINWDDVRAKLTSVQDATNNAAAQIDAGLAAVDLGAERSFPTTGVTGRCNQNTVQLRVAGSDSISDDFWWTVGTPGAPVSIANPEQPTSSGTLLARPAQIYSTDVTVPGVAHNTEVEALVLDALCLPVPGANVNFSTPANSIVTIQNPQQTTDANGVAMTTVNATNQLGEDGTATVNAGVDSVSASVGLTVIGPPSRLNLRLGGSEVQRIPNYGVGSTVQVSAVVKDANGNDVADGTQVQFTITPPDHSFSDSGQVTTSSGQASVPLVLGTKRGLYMISAEAAGATDSQQIRVVGPPDQIEVTAEPSIISVDTPIIDDRSSQITVTVKDSEGQWAPDSTIVEFEFVDPADADWAYFTLRPDNSGHYTTPLTDGQASTTLVGSPTNLSDPSQGLSYRAVDVRVTATYAVSGEVRGSVSHDITVILRGKTVFVPLITKQRQ